MLGFEIFPDFATGKSKWKIFGFDFIVPIFA